MVNRKNRYNGPKFRATRGTIQGGLVYPSLFNVTVNGVVRNWLSLEVEDRAVIQDVLVHVVGQSLVFFYVNGVLLVLKDPECIQGALNLPIGLFRRIGLAANIAKSNIKHLYCTFKNYLQTSATERVLR